MRQRKNEQYSSCILENILCVGKYSDIEKGLIKFDRKNRVTQTVEIGFKWLIQLIILYFSDKLRKIRNSLLMGLKNDDDILLFSCEGKDRSAYTPIYPLVQEEQDWKYA